MMTIFIRFIELIEMPENIRYIHVAPPLSRSHNLRSCCCLVCVFFSLSSHYAPLAYKCICVTYVFSMDINNRKLVNTTLLGCLKLSFS